MKTDTESEAAAPARQAGIKRRSRNRETGKQDEQHHKKYRQESLHGVDPGHGGVCSSRDRLRHTAQRQGVSHSVGPCHERVHICGIDLLSRPHALPELLACACVALVHVWKRNTLLSILTGTVVYMILLQAVFA